MSSITIGGVDRTELFDNFRLKITNNKRTFNSVRGMLYSPNFTIEEGEEFIVNVGTDLEFGGLLQNVVNSPTTVQNNYNVYATGYEQICDRRTISVNYSEIDAGVIATAMVTSFLTDEGITVGNIDTGTAITLQKNAVSIRDVLDDIARTSGYVWFIDNDKKLYFQDDYNYVSGTFPTDYEVVSVGRSLVGYANKVFCLGSNSIVASAEDTTEITKMAARFGSGVYGTIIRDQNADTLAKAQAVADAELAKRAFDKKYIKIKCRTRLQEGTYYTGVTIPNTDISSESYAIDEVLIEGNGESFTWTATLQPYESLILSKPEAWQQKFKQFLNTSNTEITGEGGNVYVSEEEPPNAPTNSLWVDTNDYSLDDYQAFTATGTVDVTAGRYVPCDGTFTLTLYDLSDELAKGINGSTAVMYLKIMNINTGTITVASASGETINGGASISLTSGQWAELIGYGTEWKAKVV